LVELERRSSAGEELGGQELGGERSLQREAQRLRSCVLVNVCVSERVC